MSEIEKTCENCKYDIEDLDGEHCWRCIHNAVEMFEPKERELDIQAIRNKAIDEFAERIKDSKSYIFDDSFGYVIPISEIDEIAQQLKDGGTDG